MSAQLQAADERRKLRFHGQLQSRGRPRRPRLAGDLAVDLAVAVPLSAAALSNELEECRLLSAARWCETEVPVRQWRRDASPRRALEVPVLDKERLVHFLDRPRILADRRRE